MPAAIKGFNVDATVTTMSPVTIYTVPASRVAKVKIDFMSLYSAGSVNFVIAFGGVAHQFYMTAGGQTYGINLLTQTDAVTPATTKLLSPFEFYLTTGQTLTYYTVAGGSHTFKINVVAIEEVAS